MEELVAKLGAEFVNSIHAAALADPDAMRRFVSDIPPKAEPVQACLTDVDTRRALFDELRAIYQELDPLQLDPPHATMLAVFIVAPVSEIRTQLDVFRNMEQHRPQMVTAMLARTPHATRTASP